MLNWARKLISFKCGIFPQTGECLHVLVGHVAAVRCVQYDGRLVVSGAYDYMVKVWPQN